MVIYAGGRNNKTMNKTMNTQNKPDERGGWTSASNAHADRLCAGRHNAQASMPDDPEEQSADALFGSQIHDALFAGSMDGLSPEQAAIYEQCVSIRDAVLNKVFGGDAPNAKVIKERRFKVEITANPSDKSPNPMRYGHSGKPDYIARMGNRLLIIEYKTLAGDVPESSRNEQLRDQAVLACRNLVATEAVVCVCQPLVTHDPEICVYDSAAINRAEAEMFDRIRKSNDPNALRTPNTLSCKYCKAKSVCKEYQQWASSQLPETAPVAGIPVAQWTPEQRAHFCNMLPVAQRWLDECKEEMKRLLSKDPAAIPGFVLKDGATRERVTDPQELLNRLVSVASSSSMSPQDVLTLYMECVEIRKGEFETLLRKVTGLKGKGLKSKLDDMLAGIVEAKKSQPSLAREK